MMDRLQRLRALGLPIVALTCLAILLASGLAISVFSERAMRGELAREAGAQADLLASAVSGALAFHDAAAARDYVDAVQVNPNVLTAAVYDSDGQLVASFARPGEVVGPLREPMQPTTAYRDGRLHVVRPVSAGGQNLGVAQLELRDAPASQRFSRNAGTLLVIGLAALLIAVLALTQGALRRANHSLSLRAQDLAWANDRLQEQMSERERAEEALRQSQKMEAIGRLTGGVAHDFNNLLMILSSAVELMQRTQDPARQASLMEGMRQAIERGAGLTRQLLAFSRRAPVRATVVELGEQVEGMRVLLERSLREDIALTIEVQKPAGAVELDVGELELAIVNLAVNARDAMPDGGELTIRVAPGEADEVCMEVADTGSGIPPDLIGRVFEPFFTTKDVGKGTGLGLSQVYGFAQSSGGRVSVISTAGEGTRFTLCLPVSAKGLTVAPARVDPLPVGGGEILLVEDDDGVAAGVSAMLGDLGYGHARVANAAEALALLASGRAFDLVLSDMVMPGRMGGLQLAEAIRTDHPQLPVVLSTGYSEAAATAAAGGFTVLSKPYGMNDLAAALEAARAPAFPDGVGTL